MSEARDAPEMSHPPPPSLHCPACRGAVSAPSDGGPLCGVDGAVSVALTDEGVCPRCATRWPRVAAWGRSIAVVHRDPQIEATLRATIAALRGAQVGAPGSLAINDGPAQPEWAQDPWAQSLWTWGPAHLGRYLTPPAPQPDTGWVAAVLGGLTDLPPGPVLLLGGAVGGETLQLPKTWTSEGPSARAVVCLESHPWLIAGAALATLDGARLGVLRRPGLVEWRRLRLPADARQRLLRTHLVLADAHDPPFSAASFAAIVALNVLDSVRDPWLVMRQCEAMLKTDGALLISSPWHFQPEITDDSRRLDRGLPVACDLPWLIAGRLTGAAMPGTLDGLALQHLERGLPWRIRRHDRLTWEYAVDAMLLRRVPSDD